jgi:hypothetical protein
MKKVPISAILKCWAEGWAKERRRQQQDRLPKVNAGVTTYKQRLLQKCNQHEPGKLAEPIRFKVNVTHVKRF